MIDCTILGDSIAVGIAGILHAGGWNCPSVARVGAASTELPRQIRAAGRSRIVIVSIGSNDPVGAELATRLTSVRRALPGRYVVWVLPYRRSTAYAITQVAFRFDDAVLDLAGFPSRDHIHPVNYRPLAEELTR